VREYDEGRADATGRAARPALRHMSVTTRLAGRGGSDSRDETAGTAVTTPALELYADYVCPFCWLQHHALTRIGRELDVPLRMRALELWPAPVPLPNETDLRTEWESDVEPLARALGIAARFPGTRTRTRKAHELTAFARDHGRERQVSDALFEARFVHDLDIGRIDVLVRIAESAGLDATGAKVALDIDQYTADVVADRTRAAVLGVTGIPALVRSRDADSQATLHMGYLDAAALRSWIFNDERNDNDV
jgi:predicted DsbA family dithiol-disulfide isomerase